MDSHRAAGPSEGANEVPRWEIGAAWLLRALVLGTGTWHVVHGAVLYALLCLAAIGLVVVPSYIARSSRANLPLEIELVLLWWLVADMTLGRGLRLYETIWFDKALHLGNSILLGMVGFLVVYVLSFTGRLRTSPVVSGLGIFLVALGLGAVWEIAEYVSDRAFGLGAQGSPLQAPLDDTMWDLILDGIGGAVGAVLGPMYMHSSKRSQRRLKAFASSHSHRLLGQRSSSPGMSEGVKGGNPEETLKSAHDRA